ncbi:hypothetical protein KZP23_17045 [Echinicola marina]|uniref:hypothetical protein n=1 Tax=Echinicola marina TaxID=2859768 RepID=UPI001CF6B405|nr:hypothetical protein [Echinicola marina]UCS92392.1 hypothetical protein KZP23_17045 [Echinicola marina]
MGFLLNIQCFLNRFVKDWKEVLKFSKEINTKNNCLQYRQLELALRGSNSFLDEMEMIEKLIVLGKSGEEPL